MSRRHSNNDSAGSSKRGRRQPVREGDDDPVRLRSTPDSQGSGQRSSGQGSSRDSTCAFPRALHREDNEGLNAALNQNFMQPQYLIGPYQQMLLGTNSQHNYYGQFAMHPQIGMPSASGPGGSMPAGYETGWYIPPTSGPTRGSVSTDELNDEFGEDEAHDMGHDDEFDDDSHDQDDPHDHDASQSRVHRKRRNMKPIAQQPPPHPSQKILIEPLGNQGFTPHEHITRVLRQIWYTRYTKPWPSFRHIPEDEIQIWENEFRKYFTWHPQHDVLIWRNWRTTMQKRIRTQMCTARSRDYPPRWLAPSAWAVLREYWQSESYVAMRKKNKENRWKQLNPTAPIHTPRGTHCSGSMPFSRRIVKLTKELGREPSVLEVFQNTHFREDGTRIDDISLDSFNEHLTQEIEEECRRLGVGDRELTDAEKVAPTNRAWMREHGVDRHGRVKGLGSETFNFRERHSNRRVAVRADPIRIAERFSQMTPDQHNERVVGEQSGSGSKKGKEKMPATSSTTEIEDWPPGYYRELSGFLRAQDRGEAHMSLQRFSRYLKDKYSQNQHSDSE